MGSQKSNYTGNKMKNTETLLQGKWLSVKKITWPERHIPGYVYATETSCNAQKVAVLGYKRTPEGLQFLIRDDYTPSWGDEPIRASITGGVEGDGPKYTAQLELEEEAGFKPAEDRFHFLGEVFGSKAMDTKYYLYAVDLTNVPSGTPTTENEEEKNNSFCYWTEEVQDVLFGEDCMLQTIYVRAQHRGLFNVQHKE